ncbi:MAG: septation regulator SpoVG [Oscillospiraceae bacterium]|nr:septation regulator SpoVG [Oscillospiraceae bacterium]
MNITDIRVHPVDDKGRMRAIVSVTFDNEFVVHDMKIIDGPERLFLAMPSRRTPDGDYRDIAHPINAHTREALERVVIEKYTQIVEEEAAAGGSAAAPQI